MLTGHRLRAVILLSCASRPAQGVSPPPKWKQADQAVVAEIAATGVLLLALSNCQKVASF